PPRGGRSPPSRRRPRAETRLWRRRCPDPATARRPQGRPMSQMERIPRAPGKSHATPATSAGAGRNSRCAENRRPATKNCPLIFTRLPGSRGREHRRSGIELIPQFRLAKRQRVQVEQRQVVLAARPTPLLILEGLNEGP